VSGRASPRRRLSIVILGKGGQRKPRTFTVEFKYGECEVSDELGKYMIAVGFAEKTRLILPERRSS
jgi:hypothetical protein